MIRLISFEIENYRSIIGSSLTIQPSNFTAIVGANNCGKSNILRAMQLFFVGEVEGAKYSSELDFPKSTTLNRGSQTKLTATISYDPSKNSLLKRALDEIESQSDQRRLDNNLITLRLSYSKNGVESWQFIGKTGARNIKKELIEKVRDSLRQSVVFKYIPVGRDSLDSITHEIGAELIKTIFSGWSGAVKKRQEINDSITALLGRLKPELVSSSAAVTISMQSVFHEIKDLELQLPFSNLEEMLPSLRPVLRDTAETSLKSKGAGIQTSSLLFLLKYLADNHPQRFVRQTFIWAIEEPESFLHPAKQKAMADILLQFSNEVQTIITTHCAHFVPRNNPGSACYIVDKSAGKPWSTEVVGRDYEQARQALGVSMLDSMLLFPINIVVEGVSDEILLKGALMKLCNRTKIKWHDVKIFPAGSASSATLSFEWMHKNSDSSARILLVLDGDDAGNKALSALLGRARRDGVSWISNKNYFQLPVDIENLLSNRVKRALLDERPAQVNLVEDTSGSIKSFGFVEGHKKTAAARAVELSEEVDLGEFLKVFKLIEKALSL